MNSFGGNRLGLKAWRQAAHYAALKGSSSTVEGRACTHGEKEVAKHTGSAMNTFTGNYPLATIHYSVFFSFATSAPS